MKRTAYFLIFLLFVCSQGFAISMFDDVPSSHWAYDTVRKLSDKGLMQGDGTGRFNGDRIISRYEMGQIVANVLSKVDYLKATGNCPATEELIALEELIVEFADELAFLCVKYDGMASRVADTKREVASLKKEVSGLKYRAENGNRSDNFSFFGDFRLKHTDAVKTEVGGDNVHTNAYFRLGFRAKSSENVEAVVRWTSYDYNYGLPGGAIAGANRVDNAYLTISDFLNTRGTFTAGRKYTSNGHYMVLNNYVDAVTYEKQAGKVKLGINTIFDRVENKDFHHIWNINASTECRNGEAYIGAYARTLPAATVAPIYTKQGMQIVEMGGRGTISDHSGLSYDLGVVYSSNERTNAGTKESISGIMKHLGLAWEGKSDLSGKVAYTAANHGFDGILSLDNETRYLGGPETPFEDIARFLNGMTGGVAGGRQKFYNTSDLKFQLALDPANTKHYFRVAYDKVKEIKDQVSNDFVGANIDNINAMGYNKLDMSLITLEYKYSFRPKTDFRVGYTRADKGKCLDSLNAKMSDENLLWTEIISAF